MKKTPFKSIAKITYSLLIVSVVVLSGIAASSAYFSDTETSEGNILTAGAINLKLKNLSYYNGILNAKTTWGWVENLMDGEGSSDGAYLFFDFEDLKPADYGADVITLDVDTNQSYACVDFRLAEDDDRDCNEPELALDPTCVADNDDLFDGELGAQLNFIWWADDGDNVLEVGENVLLTGTAKDIFNTSLALADSQTNVWVEGDPTPLNPESEYNLAKAWCFGDLTQDPVAQGEGVDPTVNSGIKCGYEGATNASQTDSLKVDVIFTAIQSRNNGDFLCVTGCENLGNSWVVDAFDLDQGLRKNGSAVLPARSNTSSIEGPNNWVDGGPDGTFLSLGFGGSVVAEFGAYIQDGPGPDLYIYEATGGRASYPEEIVKVYVSMDATSWTLVGEASSKNAGGISSIDLADAGVAQAAYIKIEDVSNSALFEDIADGFDIDAISAVICTDQIDG